jgi:hypothetical protein
MYLVGSALTMCGSEEAVSVDRDCFIQHRAIEATGVSRCIAGHRVISGKGNLDQHGGFSLMGFRISHALKAWLEVPGDLMELSEFAEYRTL